MVALSYSGETDEILKIVPFIHSNGNRLISMTGNPESALARNSDVHLDVGRPRGGLHPAPRAHFVDHGADRHGRCAGRVADAACGASRASISRACTRAEASGGVC